MAYVSDKQLSDLQWNSWLLAAAVKKAGGKLIIIGDDLPPEDCSYAKYSVPGGYCIELLPPNGEKQS